MDLFFQGMPYLRAEVKATDKGPDPHTNYLNITLYRDNNALPPTWQPVNNQDIDNYIMKIQEDVGPSNQLDTIFSVSEELVVDFILPTGEFPENNLNAQFETVRVSDKSMRIRKKQRKTVGGKDPLKYIKLRSKVN